MSADVGSRTFPVRKGAISCWIVVFISVVKFVMMVIARHVGREACISADAGRGRKREIVAIEIFGVMCHVRKLLVVGSMCVAKGVMLGNVVIAHCKGKELALAGRECTKEWIAMSTRHCVAPRVTRC